MSVTYEDKHGKKVIAVDGQPFLLLAGEVCNSNSSSLEYMEQVWEKAGRLGMNTLLLPITWELLEPEEGVFDFTLADGLIGQARKYGKKIVFLWFGAWKNAQCYYAPAWVKTNLRRFKRAEVEKGHNGTTLAKFHGMPYTTLSYLCEETNRADARAFGELMRHIRQVDERENTVVAVQVENEPGLQGAAREHSDTADARFAADVPQALVNHMKACTGTMAPDVAEAVRQGACSGSWQAVFGPVAEEVFSACHIAAYIEKVAAAGKDAYALPMFVNCWLDKGQEPGIYPSGGPVARMMEVWRYAAPSIDVFGADIYVPGFLDVCDQYVKLGNPLFIPETAAHKYAGPRLVHAIGRYHALGFAPFSFESIGGSFRASDAYLFGIDVNDPNLDYAQNPDEYCWNNQTLHSLMPLLAERYGTARLQSVISERPEQNVMDFGAFSVQARFADTDPRVNRDEGVCLAIQMSDNAFYLIAYGCSLNFVSNDPDRPCVDFLAYEEGAFRDGTWRRGRRLNGDEAASRCYNEPVLLRASLFAYQ